LRKFLGKLKQKNNLSIGVLVGPSMLWLLAFFLIPLCIMLIYSFCKHTYASDVRTGVSWVFTLENYLNALDRTYVQAILRSFWIAIINTLLCLIISYPIAYYISHRKPKLKNILLILVIIPFWTNFIVRTYAWMVILRENGLINIVLTRLGLINDPLQMLFTNGAVITGLVYGYLPFMILPLYASIEKVNPSLLEASYDLGANRLQTFFRVMLPLTMPGIIAGSLLVFVPTLGAFVTPDLLGGAKVMMIGNIIQNQYTKVRNWPFGSSLSFILLSVVLALLFIYVRFGDSQENHDKNKIAH
jgi:spermidine/putrescine transport system permease protein